MSADTAGLRAEHSFSFRRPELAETIEDERGAPINRVACGGLAVPRADSFWAASMRATTPYRPRGEPRTIVAGSWPGAGGS